jgi:hypothetical protein
VSSCAVVRGDDAEMLVVAPASKISRLDWLANAEDDARTEAAALAAKTAEATPTDDVVGRVGDSDPVKAIEDALRTFAADEVLVVAHPDDHGGWLAEGAPAKAQARFSLRSPSSRSPRTDRSRVTRRASTSCSSQTGCSVASRAAGGWGCRGVCGSCSG